jgi:hypothetical protein
VIGVIGGGAVTALFKMPDLFASYAIGLAVGFIGYLLVNLVLAPADATGWMGGKDG